MEDLNKDFMNEIQNQIFRSKLLIKTKAEQTYWSKQSKTIGQNKSEPIGQNKVRVDLLVKTKAEIS